MSNNSLPGAPIDSHVLTAFLILIQLPVGGADVGHDAPGLEMPDIERGHQVMWGETDAGSSREQTNPIRKKLA